MDDKTKILSELEEVEDFLKKLMKMYNIRQKEAEENESENEDDLEELMDSFKSTNFK